MVDAKSRPELCRQPIGRPRPTAGYGHAWPRGERGCAVGDAPSGEHPRDRQSRQMPRRDASQSCNVHDGLARHCPSAMPLPLVAVAEWMERGCRHARPGAFVSIGMQEAMLISFRPQPQTYRHSAIAQLMHRMRIGADHGPEVPQGGSFRAGLGPPTRRQGPYPPAIFLCIKHASDPQLYLAIFCLIMYLAGILYPDICNLGGISWTGRYLKAGLNS